MRKIALANRKGGCGKTTTAVNLAHGLALRGERVLLIDTDSQGHVGISLGLKGFDDTLSELLEGEATVEDCTVEARPNLDVIPADDRLSRTERGMARDDLGVYRLSKVLEGIEDYSFVILDCGPGWGTLSVAVLLFADEVILPCNLAFLSLVGLKAQIESIETVQEYNPDLVITHILPTKLDRRTRQSKETLDMLEEHFGDLVAEPIRVNVRLAEAASHGRTIFEYDPRSRGAQDYARLTKEVLEWQRKSE